MGSLGCRGFFLISAVLLGWGLMVESKPKPKLKIILVKVDVESDPEYMKLTVQLKNSTNNNVVVADIESELLQDWPEDVYIQNDVMTRFGSGEYQTLLKSEYINLCNFLSNSGREPFLKLMFDNLHKYGNLMQSCPIIKGSYYLRDFTLDPQSLPSFTPVGNYKVSVSAARKEGPKYFQIYKMTWYAQVSKAKK